MYMHMRIHMRTCSIGMHMHMHRAHATSRSLEVEQHAIKRRAIDGHVDLFTHAARIAHCFGQSDAWPQESAVHWECLPIAVKARV